MNFVKKNISNLFCKGFQCSNLCNLYNKGLENLEYINNLGKYIFYSLKFLTKNVNITLFTFLSILLFHLPISVEFVLYVWQYWWSVKPKMKTGMKKKIQKVTTLWVQHFVYTQAYLFCDSTLAFSKESPCDRCKHIRLYCKLMHIDSCTDIVGERGWGSGIPITLENQIIKY